MDSSRPLKIQFEDSACARLKQAGAIAINVPLVVVKELVRIPCHVISVVATLIVLNIED